MSSLRLLCTFIFSALLCLLPISTSQAQPCVGEPELGDIYFSAPGIAPYPLSEHADPLADFSLPIPLAPGASEARSFTLHNTGTVDYDVVVHVIGVQVPNGLLTGPSVLTFSVNPPAVDEQPVLSPATGEQRTLTVGPLLAGEQRTIELAANYTWSEVLNRDDMNAQAHYRYRLGMQARCIQPPTSSSALPGEPTAHPTGGQGGELPVTGVQVSALFASTLALLATGVLLLSRRRQYRAQR